MNYPPTHSRYAPPNPALVVVTGCADMSSGEQRTPSGAATGNAAGYALGAVTGMSKGTGMALGAATGAASGFIHDKYKHNEGHEVRWDYPSA